jgi:hypothetical protein
MATKIILGDVLVCIACIGLLPPYSCIVVHLYLWAMFWVAMLRSKKWRREETADIRGQRVVKYTLVPMNREELLKTTKEAQCHVYAGLICSLITFVYLYSKLIA